MSEGKSNPEEARTSYDAVRYPSYVHAQTHPDQLAMKGRLFGLKTAPVETCRVLELGCGDGASLLSFAQQLPGATFVGVDLAAEPVEQGARLAAELGLKNVSLRAMSVMDIGRDFGEFDYIIAHGIYSWVPEVVRAKILEIASVNLAPQGVAQISYQANPGGLMRNMVREMMLHHVKGFTDPDERVHQAMALVKFLSEAGKPGVKADDVEPYRLFLKQQFDGLEERDKTTIYHDELSEVHRPFWFHEFIEDAGRHGLQFLCEADYVRPEDSGFNPDALKVLRQLSTDRLRREQYQDFAGFRRFRQTLLCHRGQPLRFGMSPSDLAGVFLSSPARPAAPDFEMGTMRPEKFVGDRNSSFEIEKPFAKAALVSLAEAWPLALSFSEMVKRARAHLGAKGPAEGPDFEALSFFESILQIYVPGLLMLHLFPPQLVREPGPTPRASRLARWQAARFTEMVSQRHVHVTLRDPVERRFLELLDGTRDRAALAGELARLRAEATAGGAAAEGTPAEAVVEPGADEILERFGRLGLLEA